MTHPSFAGYTYKRKLGASFYGQLHRASDTDGHDVEVLHVSPRLAALAGFAEVLTAGGEALNQLFEPRVIRTRLVGAATDGTLVVVTEHEPRHLSLEDLLRVSPAGLPALVAASIGQELVSVLANAHRQGVVHGAVHPRSVMLGIDGSVYVRDFAVGRAVTVAGTRARSMLVLEALRGYVAPEIVKGRLPAVSTDVYAAAAVFYAILSGSVPPGTLGRGPALERMIQRALDANVSRRYATADELLEHLSESLEDERWARASNEELAGFVMDARPKIAAAYAAIQGQGAAPAGPGSGAAAAEPGRPASPAAAAIVEPHTDLSGGPGGRGHRGSGAAAIVEPHTDLSGGSELDSVIFGDSDDSLDDETEDFLSSLDDDAKTVFGVSPLGSVPEPAPARLPLADDSVDRLDSVLTDFEPPTRVETNPRDRDHDPVSELIALAGLGDPLDPMRPPTELGGLDPDTTVLAPMQLPLPALPEPKDEGDDGGGDQHGNDGGKPGRTATELAALEAIASLDDRSDARPLAGPEAEWEARPEAGPDARALDRAIEGSSQQAALAALELDMSHPSRDPGRANARPSSLRDRFDKTAAIIRFFSGGSRWAGRIVWSLAVLIGAGALVWIIKSQTGMRDQARQRHDQQKADAEAALAENRRNQPRDGQVSIDSEPSEAAVWMLLGRTPLDSRQVSTAQVHDLRLELDGYQVHDARIDGSAWTGEGEARVATARVELGPRDPRVKVPPYPPEPPESAQRGLRAGKGYLRIESAPPGADVWLLVGFTSAELAGEAGLRYTFKLQKQGYLPETAVVEARDWSGDNRVSRSVTLTPMRRGR